MIFAVSTITERVGYGRDYAEAYKQLIEVEDQFGDEKTMAEDVEFFHGVKHQVSSQTIFKFVKVLD